MSTLQNTSTVWNPLTTKEVDSKHEKCRNITEEIYKRINITFQIKKLETQSVQSDLSDNSDQIDSNELSNETDLFACDKTSISSSTDNEQKEKPASARYIKFINNNNEEPKKPATVYKRPRKRFRKRVKKQSRTSHVDSDASSDEALPLCRVVGVESGARQDAGVDCCGALEGVMGVNSQPVFAKDLKVKLRSAVNACGKSSKPVVASPKRHQPSTAASAGGGETDSDVDNRDVDRAGSAPEACCQLCTSRFRGERSLRRHMTLTHLDKLVAKVSQKKKKEIISA